MATIQARVSKDEKQFIDNYVAATNISLSQLVRDAVIEKIENEVDVELYKKAMAEHNKRPQDVTPFEDYLKELADE